METIIQRERYSDQTIAVVEQMGEDRLNALQVAIAGHSPEGQLPSAIRLIDGMVTKHEINEGVALGEIGYATIADALSEIGTSKGAVKTLLKGKMGIQRAVDAHHQRAAQVAAAADKQLLRELGIADTATLYVDEPTNLHLVHLSTPEHCQYEGVSLVHCLGNLATASAYLTRGALLYSLREDGTEPRVTIEVSAEQSAVTQARGKNDQPLHEDSTEYHALRRSLAPLAAHVALVAPPALTITDTIVRR
jgi:hypothetical protein